MSALPTCAVTGRIAGDSDACGDCDPCSAAYAVPDVVKRLLAEKDEWREKYSNAMAELDSIKSGSRCDMCGELREGKDHSGCDVAYTGIVGHGHYP